MDVLKQKGNEAFSNGKYEDACKFYTDAINLDPKNHILVKIACV